MSSRSDEGLVGSSHRGSGALVVAAFQSSLDNLLLAATKHRGMNPLRDAVQSTRMKGYIAEDVFHTLVLACDSLNCRRQYRSLLMQSLSDLGKMPSLRMLPMSCNVISVICHLVVKLLGRAPPSGSINVTQSGVWSTTMRGKSVDTLANHSVAAAEGGGGIYFPDIELREGSIDLGGLSVDSVADAQPPDEELQMRILQTLMAYLSACELSNTALSDVLSILFVLYIQATPGSMVELTCAATIEERTQALFRCLRSNGDNKAVEDDNTLFTAQIQAVAYAKDVCSLCAQHPTKWLKLNLQRHNSFIVSLPMDTTISGAMNVPPPPRRLRLLLLRTLITHFIESERINSVHETNVFFIQYLNEDIISLVLGRLRASSSSQRETGLEIDEDDNLVDLLSLMDEETNEEEFYLTQHLGVVVISKALPVMRRAMPILLRHHVILVKLSNAEDIAEVAENARRMTVVLKLWSKAIADHELLQELLLITPSTSTFLASRIPHIIQQQQQQQIVEERGGKKKQTSEEESSSSAMTLFRDVFYNQGGGGGNSGGGGAMSDGIDSTYPFADLVIMTAEILSNIIIASDGVFNLDHIKSADEKNRPPAGTTSSSSPPLPPPVASTIGGSHWATLSTAFSRPLRFTNPTMKTTTTTTTAPTAVAAAGGQDRESVENLPSERGLVSDVEERHPATRHTADILSFLTMFTQSFSRVIEVSKLESAASRNVINNNNDNNNNNVVGAAPTVVNTEEEVRALFILLHSSLFHCFSLAAKHLRGDDVIHMILKGITHLIHASCTLGLSAERDSYLQIFVTRLNMPQEEQLYSLEGKFVETTTIQPKYKDVKEHTSSLSSAPSPIKTTKLVEVVGGGNVSVIKPPQHMARRTSAFRQSLNALQEKLYVLNCVISVANCMGPSLGEGWAPVTSCLLLTEPLLKDFHTLVEQQQQQQRQYKRGAIDEITLQDALRNADRVRDALYILFINSALLPDTVALEGLLKNFVSQTCKRPPSEYLLSLRMTSECCALSLITIAACRLDVSLSCLWRLWCTVKPLYLHVFDPVTIVQLVHFCSHSNRKMEVVAGTLERLVEEIAVVTAQLCQRLNNNNNNNNNNNSGCEEKRSKSQGNRKEEEVEGKDDVLTFRFAAGPYATAPLVSRLVSLCPTPRRIKREVFHVDPHVYKKGGNVLVDANYNENNEAQSRPILASTTELLATIYVYLQQHQHRQRKPKEQQRHDEEENSSVSLSQQARQQQQQQEEEEQEQEEEEEDEEEKQMSESVKTVTCGVSLVLLKEVSKLVQGFGEDLRGAAWEHLLRLLRHTTTSPSMRMRKKNNDGNSNNNNTLYVTTSLASVQQSISIAFRTLETIQHSCITSLDDEGLRQLIRCGGAFMVHHSPGFEHRLNINLSSVQLLWSIADYVVSRENGNEKNNDLLWCTLLMQLYDGCLDVRPEVRQSALKTLFSLLQTYAGRLSAECWRCALIAVFIPLMDVSILGADTCIVSADAPAVSSTLSSRRCSAISQRLRRRSSESVSTATISESVQTLYDGYTNEEEWHIATLLTHLGKHPTLFEDMRVTIMDAISRVFASHYQAMYAALVLQCEDLHQRTDGEALLHEVLALFTKLCGTSRYVVKTTTGESAALSAVRALHLLMTVTEPVLMTEGELESAWFEIERLLRRDNDCQHTERKQCTAAVVASIVTSLGDVVALRITGNKQRQQQSEGGGGITTTTTTAAAANSMGPPLTSSPSTLLQHLYHAFSPSPTRIINTDDSTRHDYFPDYLRIMQDSLCSFAVVESYFFPSRVQTAVIEVWKTLWPLLDGHERGAIVSIALQQFPARHSITAFLAQGEVGAVVSSPTKKRRETVVRIAELSQSSTTTMQQQQKEDEEPSSSSHKQQQQQSISLSEIVPPTSHPNFLLALMDFLCRVGEEEKLEQLYVKRMMHIVAPSVIRVIGALLLLEYASPALLAVPGPRLPVHIPNDFFDKAERCFTFFLLEVLWDETSTATLSGTSTPVPPLGVAYDPPSSLSMNRREGLLAFAFTFSTLVSHANLQIDVIERERRAQTVVGGGGESGASTCNVAPENLRSAFQRLERFVIILNDLIPDVIRRTGDVSTATELLSALVPSSSLESPLFAAVAKRSLDVLRSWSLHTCDHGSISTEKETLMSVTQKQPKDGKSDASEANNSRQPSEDAKKLMTATTRKVGGENDDHDNDGVSCGKGKELSSRLKNVARASMGARNQVVLRKFLSNTANEDTRQMMKTTLQTLVLLYPPRADTQQAESKRRLRGTMPLSKEHVDTLNKSSGDDSDETAEGVKVLQGILMDLARLVEHTGDDRELQPLLSRAMLGICASLGFSSS